MSSQYTDFYRRLNLQNIREFLQWGSGYGGTLPPGTFEERQEKSFNDFDATVKLWAERIKAGFFDDSDGTQQGKLLHFCNSLHSSTLGIQDAEFTMGFLAAYTIFTQLQKSLEMVSDGWFKQKDSSPGTPSIDV